MPDLTITLRQATVDKLQREVQRTNEAQGTDYTTSEWIALHLDEIAIAPELQAAVEALQRQAETDARQHLETAIKTARDELLAALAEDGK
jgi:hypothetical protein